jgi:hypothetical protein
MRRAAWIKLDQQAHSKRLAGVVIIVGSDVAEPRVPRDAVKKTRY